MQIRKIGRQPENHYTIVTNSMVRDARLSFRARGVMAYVCSHADGFHISADVLAREGREGRDALRTAMNELVEANYMRRVRRQDGEGKWRTDINVYPYGDAPEIMAPAEREVTEQDIEEAVSEPTTDFQSSVSQSPVSQSPDSQALVEDHQEDSFGSPSAAAGDSPTEVTHEQQPEARNTRVTPGFPVVEQRKLMAWFGVTSAEQGEAWTAAWLTAQSFVTSQPGTTYDPEAHLAIYLSRCREERRQPRSDLWLRFFIEDRAKHIATLQQQGERQQRAEEDPQQREDRATRALPPADWGPREEQDQ